MTDLEQLIGEIDNTSISDLFRLLQAGKINPTVTRQPEGSYGSFYPRENRLNIHPQLVGGALRDITGHELTHALDQAMLQHSNVRNDQQERVNPKFRDALEKMVPTGSGVPAIADFVARYNSGKKTKPGEAYRMSDPELRAHAFQNRIIGNDQPDFNPAPPHVDSTMATELSILMDLYNRSLQGKYK